VSRLQIRRRFPGISAERLFRAWTDPALLAEWYGPEGLTVTVHHFDARPGGSYVLTMTGPDGAYPLRGTYREVSPFRRLVFTWAWDNPVTTPEETLVEVDIGEGADGATLLLTHSGFAGPEGAKRHEEGWTSTMAKFTDWLNQ
jgi:uncharacterized protein YndB with AHSA1/START domain